MISLHTSVAALATDAAVDGADGLFGVGIKKILIAVLILVMIYGAITMLLQDRGKGNVPKAAKSFSVHMFALALVAFALIAGSLIYYFMSLGQGIIGS